MMKNFLKTGKKTLSVIMAIMMLMTAWVWVAPEKASAAEAGTYTVKVIIDVSNGMYSGDEIVYVDYYTDNGTGTADTESKNFNTGTYNEDTTEIFTNLPGFPYQVRAYCSGSNYTNAKVVYGIKVYIVTDEKEIEIYNNGDNEFTHTSGLFSTVSAFTDTVTIPKEKFPYVSTFPSATKSRDIYLPTIISSNRYSNNTVTIGQAKDQYGVNYIDPDTITVSGSACGTTGLTTSKSGSVLTVTGANTAKNENGTSQTATVVAKWKSANSNYNTSSKYRSKTYSDIFTIYNPEHEYIYNGNGGTVTMESAIKFYADTIGSSFPSTGTRSGYTFLGMFAEKYDVSYEENLTISEQLSSSKVVKENKTWYAAWQANQYSMKFTYRDDNCDWVTSDESIEYYGRNIPFPTISRVINKGVDYTYTFKNWSPEYTTVQAVDGVMEYTAVYDEEIHYADLTSLQTAINKAGEKKDTDLYKENAYTETTTSTFEDSLALAEMTVARKPLLSEQNYVDALAESLVNATNRLDIKNYTVIFIDENGTILDNGYFFVQHGAKVDVPNNIEKAYDETNHYAFDLWDLEESDRLDACNYVTDNLVYVAAFLATPHTYSETKIDSTCVSDGVTKYTCECGYSYTAVNPDDLASHTWSEDYKELIGATCATAGSEALYCIECGAINEASKREIPTLGHDFGEYTEYTPATCFGEGSKIAECSRCQGKDVEKIPQLSHSYDSVTDVEKTCTTDGYTKEVCSVCGFVNIRDIDAATGHETETEKVNATCVSIGYEKVTCKNCDYEKKTIIPATGNHSYPETWTIVAEASCIGQGVEKRVCTVCNAATETRLTDIADHTKPADWTTEVEASCDGEGRKIKNCTVCGKELEAEKIEKLGHDYTVTENAPTCTTAGSIVETCSKCGDTNTKVTQPLTHSWNAGITTEATCSSGAYITYTCQRDGCGETKIEIINGSAANPHDFDDTIADNVTITPATCVSDGKKTVKCSRCDATTEVIIPKFGHSYGAWVKTNATNDTDGSWYHKCATCGKEETLVIPAGGHTFVEDTEQYVAPQCNEKGQRVYKCTAHENCIAQVVVELDYAQHVVAQRVTEASCTQKGTVEAYCSECNTTLHTIETAIKPHNPVAGETTAPTCTTSGYTTYTCACGNFSYNEYDETKPALGHDFDDSIEANVKIIKATCDTDGSKIVNCSRCNDKEITLLAKTGHTYKKTVADATCATPEITTYTCDCGSTYSAITDVKTDNHSFAVKENVKATETSLGYIIRECACGQKDIEILPATGEHVINEETARQAATCTADGWIDYKCRTHTDCGVTDRVILPATGHTETLDYKAPTCTDAGYSRMICSVDGCGAVIMNVEISAKGHAYNTVEISDATCTEDGTRTYKCACGDTKTETIPAKGHNLTTVVSDATCGNKGSVVTTCSDCNYTDTTELSAKNHNWNEGVITTPASCEGEGEKTYTCSVCGTSKTEKIPAKGHSYGEWTVTPSTNDAVGSVSRKCACGDVESVEIPAGNHNLVVDSENSTAASCKAQGTTTFKCETHNGTCGIALTVTTAKTQHNLETKIVNEVSCTENGKVETRCTECGDLLVETIIPAKGHAYNNVTVSKDATCTVDGERKYSCACGEFLTEVIPAKGHSYKTTTTPATCTTAGSVVTECTVCKADSAKTETVLPAMGHDYTGAETLIKSATCDTDGSKTVKCSRCDATTTVVLPKFGHSYGDWVETPATNTDNGSWYHKCATCGKEETLVIPAGGHTFVEDESQYVAPKCNKKGQRIYKCTAHTNCIEEVVVILDFAPHTIVNDNKAASCTDNGYSKTYCSVCTTVFNNVEIPATQHSYTGKVTLDASCTAEGVKTYTCSKCSDSYIEAIPMIQHVYEEIGETEATCTSNGYKTYKCNTCDSSYKVITEEAKTHNYSEFVSSTASCTSAGTMTLKCADCDVTMTTSVVALGHDYNKTSSTSATCTAAATETYTCSRCTSSYTISVGDKLAHSFSEWKVIVEATEDALGYKTRSCACGKIELETINAIGNHSFDNLISETPATCTTAGEKVYGCSTHNDCGLTSTVVIPATGHDKVIVTENADCENAGKITTTCKNCTEYKTEETIPALGHKYAEGKVTPATCKSEGSIVYTCGTCSDTHTTVITVDKNAHQYEVVVNSATCTAEGAVYAKCKLCEDETEKEALPKLEHTWANPVTENADCEVDGKTTYTCECGETKVVTIPKLGHKMVAGTSVDATCTENGYTPYTCSNADCDYSYNVYNTSAKGHTYAQVDDSSTATCTAGGTVTLKCTCGDEITANAEALGHDWGEWEITKNPTATDEGIKTRECKRTDCTEKEEVALPALGHEMVKSDAQSTAPSCILEGTDVYVCTTHSDCGYTYSVTVAKTAHVYGKGVETVKATCTTDGEMTYRCTCGATKTEIIPKTGHTLTTEVTSATCKVEGKVVTSCACGYKIETNLGYGAHNRTVYKTQPTCVTSGEIVVRCSVCLYDFSADSIPATGHSFAGQGSVITEATCTTDGKIKYVCAIEGCDGETIEEVPATGHNYVAGDKVEATCTESGYTPYTCANNCGSSYSKLDSQPVGHSWNEGTVKDYPTCNAEGVLLVECDNCDKSYEKAIAKLEHTWDVWQITKNPTATEEGEMTRICIRGCGVSETAPVPALGGGSVSYTVTFVADGITVATQTVNYGGSATAPDVSKAPDENGHYSYIWDVDFTNVTDNLTVTAIYTSVAHIYGNWITDVESTCKTAGLQHRECSVCRYTEFASVGFSDHDYSEVLERKDPTCTENGYMVVVCADCGNTEKEVIKRLGHSMTYHERVYETCDEDGLLAHYSCARCGKNFEDRGGTVEIGKVVIGKKYHTFIIIDGFAATCTSNGATSYRHCTTCGLNQPSEPIPALGHIDANNDHICDRCSGAYMEGGEMVCVCSCHKVGFFNELIYKILRFFWKLFGNNKTCECGVIHY